MGDGRGTLVPLAWMLLYVARGCLALQGSLALGAAQPSRKLAETWRSRLRGVGGPLISISNCSSLDREVSGTWGEDFSPLKMKLQLGWAAGARGLGCVRAPPAASLLSSLPVLTMSFQLNMHMATATDLEWLSLSLWGLGTPASA